MEGPAVSVRRRKTMILFALVGLATLMLLVGGVHLVSLQKRVPPPIGDLPESVEGEKDGFSRTFEDRFLGHTKESIIRRFGPPSVQFDGHYANPPFEYRWFFFDAVTLMYERPSGSLYLSFCYQKGQWVCFSADWLPTGAVF